MSELDNEIKRLADAAIDIATIQIPMLRHKGGFWLQGELEKCFESHLFSEDQRIDFMAVVKILLDVIFRDAVESSADLVPMDVGKTAFADMVKIAEAEARKQDSQLD